MVVFLSTCDSVNFHFAMCLRAAELAAFKRAEQDVQAIVRLHGNMGAAERAESLQRFCGSEDGGVLFCTDVAARGLNLPKVEWIVQFDPPTETTEYVHRVGRTARSGAGGQALLFLLRSELGYLKTLSARGLQLQRVAPEALMKGLRPRADGRPTTAVTRLQRDLEDCVADGPIAVYCRTVYRCFRPESTRNQCGRPTHSAG